MSAPIAHAGSVLITFVVDAPMASEEDVTKAFGLNAPLAHTGAVSMALYWML